MKLKLFSIALACFSLYSYGQDATGKKTKYRKTMPVCLEVSVGTNNSRFIDFGTSPLYYQGMLRQFGLSYRKLTDKREVVYAVNYMLGSHSLSYNSVEAESQTLLNLDIRHSRLYKLNVLTNDKWNLKVGGTIDARALGRMNPALMNNQFGSDLFVNIMASGKMTYDISNSTNKKFWFVKAKAKERKLSYQLDLGVINSTFRNGFIYSNSNSVYSPDPGIFSDHKFSVFSGFRMGSRLDYEHTIFNNNTLRFSYIWDAMMSGDTDSDRFQMVNNIFLVSLNIKIR